MNTFSFVFRRSELDRGSPSDCFATFCSVRLELYSEWRSVNNDEGFILFSPNLQDMPGLLVSKPMHLEEVLKRIESVSIRFESPFEKNEMIRLVENWFKKD